MAAGRKKSQQIKDTLVINFKTKKPFLFLLPVNAKQIKWMILIIVCWTFFLHWNFCRLIEFSWTFEVFHLILEAWISSFWKGKQITSLCDDTMIGLLTKTEILSYSVFLCFSLQHFDAILVIYPFWQSTHICSFHLHMMWSIVSFCLCDFVCARASACVQENVWKN